MRAVAIATILALSVPVIPVRPVRAGSDARGGSVVRWEKSSARTVVVPAGPFLMGFQATESENRAAQRECLDEIGKVEPAYCDAGRSAPFRWYSSATPARNVDMHAFEIDRYEVSVKDFRRCVGGGACDVAGLLVGDTRYIEEAWPMVNVTWQDAVDYCTWVGKRLPTEAEWEKAARGTDGRRWPWGNQIRNDGANHGQIEDMAMSYTHSFVPGGQHFQAELEPAADGSDGAMYATAPGSFVWGESPYGVMDMAGNVEEWVMDYYWPGIADSSFGIESNGYADLPAISPVRLVPKDRVTDRVARGGSWLLPLLLARTYARRSAPAGSRSPTRGFRCARDYSAGDVGTR